jgi:hypothetical protein
MIEDGQQVIEQLSDVRGLGNVYYNDNPPGDINKLWLKSGGYYEIGSDNL